MTRGTPLNPRTTSLRLAPGVESQRTPEGVVRLTGAPLRPWGPLKLLAWLMRVPKRPVVELDRIGTWVLDRIADHRLDELADALAAHAKLTRREAETALADFVGLLRRRQLVDLVVSDPASSGASPSASAPTTFRPQSTAP